MLSNKKFLEQPHSFWAQVKLVSMVMGYSEKNEIKVYDLEEIIDCLKKYGQSILHLKKSNLITKEAQLLIEYFKYRAEILKKYVEPNLMNREEAKKEFEKIFNSYKHKVKLPLNKQKGDKKHYSYLTGIVNMLTEINLNGVNFDADPRKMILVTQNNKPLRVLGRRLDGAYPSIINPLSIWEVKEYYGTTTFGSRVADGVYETMLDGHELKELNDKDGIKIKHFLIVDDYFTWWKCGKSYLCRLIDLLHEGYLDEVIFGKEVIIRWPLIVKEWLITK